MVRNRTFIITATDEYMLSNVSNIVYLTVVDVPDAVQPPSDAGSSGGGGGGGGGGYYDDVDLDEYKESPDCSDEWVCSEWSGCSYRWSGNVTADGSVVVNETDGHKHEDMH
jgi:hypothetical protein